MASQAHSRNVSEETTASTSSYQHILEHLLQYPGNYEIPLRTMYTINSASRARPLARSRAPTPTSSTGPASPTSGQFAWSADNDNPSHEFTASLMNQISQLPSQPCSLPPTFIVSFVARIFPPSLQNVQFTQALAALDYIRDLETRRRKELAAAFRRLSVLPNTVGTEADDFSERYPGVGKWVRNAEAKNAKAEIYYCQVWVSLRRWVMINEMSSEPYSKHNCVAMLNTLYPPPHPGVNTTPIKGLTPEKYKEQRDGFFNYITAVGKRGPLVLRNLQMQGRLEGDLDGWGATQLSLDKFLAVAKQMIDDCCEISTVDHLDPVQDTTNRKGKKTDSGVSFGSNRRPSTSGKELPLPPTTPTTPLKSSQKGLSTLEKITREFKRMRVKTRPDVEEIAKPERTAPLVDITDNDNKKSKPKQLKKMKSMGSLSTLKTNNMSATSLIGRRKASDTDNYDVEEMKRQRMKYETAAAKGKGKSLRK